MEDDRRVELPPRPPNGGYGAQNRGLAIGDGCHHHAGVRHDTVILGLADNHARSRGGRRRNGAELDRADAIRVDTNHACLRSERFPLPSPAEQAQSVLANRTDRDPRHSG